MGNFDSPDFISTEPSFNSPFARHFNAWKDSRTEDKSKADYLLKLELVYDEIVPIGEFWIMEPGNMADRVVGKIEDEEGE